MRPSTRGGTIVNCPLCVDEVLDVTHHQGIEIDVCPRCRGIWLDRGELDRLMGPTEPSGRAAVAPSGGADVRARDDTVDVLSPGRAKKNKKRRLMDKLGDALEEVLDL